MRLATLALVTTLGCSSSAPIPRTMRSPRQPQFVCGTPALMRQSIVEQAIAPVALFLVGAVVVGGAYLAIGGDAP
jgi:hypothetical protein